MTDSMSAREFFERFTKPACEHWKVNQHVEHLAVHALSQIAILAEVASQQFGGKDYLQGLESRHEVLRTIREAVNSHKHGWPRNEKERQSFKQGQRVATETDAGFFVDHTPIGEFTVFQYVGLKQDTGKPFNVSHLILRGLRAWELEFQRLGT